MLPRNLLTILAAATVLVPQSNAQGSGPGRIHGIRFWSFGDVTRIAIETTGDYKLSSDQIENPARVYFDLNGLHASSTNRPGMQTIPVDDKRIKQIRVAEVVPGKTRIVFDLEGPVEVVSSQLVNPDRLMIEIRPKGTGLAALEPKHSATSTPRTDSVTTVSVPVPTRRVESPGDDIADLPEPRVSGLHHPPSTSNIASAAAAKRDSSGDRSLVRVFGLKLGRVVIDAGHGGKDTGTIGPNGLMEKDLVLDVALRLGRLINGRLGADVVYTRSSDVFIPLEERTKIANDQHADLFISVHANSSPESSATGVETYYFNLTSDKKGLDLATRENATSVSSISDLNDMLHRAVLQAKLEESREFAQKIQQALLVNSKRMNNKAHDRGVRQAPFVVLIGATMPSILAEIGFVSNPHDERLMKRSDQREKIAEALLRGVTQYANSLSHTQMASAGSD
ncbi:MAG TPA: N-acetylmuramoyl-L-alanine amidase [Bryobacteraceae bacterium]